MRDVSSGRDAQCFHASERIRVCGMRDDSRRVLSPLAFRFPCTPVRGVFCCDFSQLERTPVRYGGCPPRVGYRHVVSCSSTFMAVTSRLPVFVPPHLPSLGSFFPSRLLLDLTTPTHRPVKLFSALFRRS